MLRFFRHLGIDGTLVWALVALIIPVYVGEKASRKNPFWLFAIVPWAIAWGYPIGLLENPFSAREYWFIGILFYAASVLVILELTTENARQYANRRDTAQKQPTRKSHR